jgi:O-antigen/teichoic acid export membrane protein
VGGAGRGKVEEKEGTVTRSTIRREPSWPSPIAAPQRPLPGSDPASWFTSRARSAQITFGGIFLSAVLGWLAVRQPHYAVALCVGVALIVAVVIRPQVGALCLVALVPALSGLVPGTPVPNVRITELLIGTVGITLLVVTRRFAATKWGALDWLLLAYGLLWTVDGVLGALLLHERLSLSQWGTVVGQLQFFVLYRSVRVTLRTSEQRRLALRWLFISAGVVALLAVFQEIRVPTVASFIVRLTGTVSAPGAGGIVRATGPFANWAALAGYLVPLVLVALCLGLGNVVRSHRKTIFAVALLLLLALFFTAELSVIISLLIGACVLGLRYGRGRTVMQWLALALAVIAVGAGSFLAHRLGAQFSTTAGTGRPAFIPQTLGFRWQVWTGQYIPAILQRPITGWGVILPGSIRWPDPESQYIAFLIDGGIPLLAMFGFLFAGMVREAKRVTRSIDQVDRALGEALLVTVVLLGVVNFIWPFLSNGGMPQMLWCLFALLPPILSRDSSHDPLAIPYSYPLKGPASPGNSPATHLPTGSEALSFDADTARIGVGDQTSTRAGVRREESESVPLEESNRSQPLRQLAIRGGAYLLVREAVGMVIRLAGLVITLRLIGPSSYGIYAGAAAFVLVVTTVAQMGGEIFLIKMTSIPDRSHYNEVFTLLLVTSLAATGLALVGTWAFSGLIRPVGVLLPLRVLLLSVPINVLWAPAQARIERGFGYRKMGLLEVGGDVVLYGVAVPLAFLGFGAWSLVIGFLAWQLWLLVGSYLLSGLRLRLRWSKSMTRELTSFGFSYSLQTGTSQLSGLVNPLVVGTFLGATGVGYVAFALRLVSTIGFAMRGAWRLGLVSLSRIPDGDTERLRRAVEEGSEFLLIALGVPFAIFGVMARTVVPLFFGQEWSTAIRLYTILALVTVVGGSGFIQVSLLISRGRNFTVAIAGSFQAVILAIGAYFLVRRFGLNGFGYATILTVAGLFYVDRATRSIVSFGYRKYLLWLLAMGPLVLYPLPPFPVSLVMIVPLVVMTLIPSTRREGQRQFVVVKNALSRGRSRN